MGLRGYRSVVILSVWVAASACGSDDEARAGAGGGAAASGGEDNDEALAHGLCHGYVPRQ